MLLLTCMPGTVGLRLCPAGAGSVGREPASTGQSMYSCTWRKIILGLWFPLDDVKRGTVYGRVQADLCICRSCDSNRSRLNKKFLLLGMG